MTHEIRKYFSKKKCLLQYSNKPSKVPNRCFYCTILPRSPAKLHTTTILHPCFRTLKNTKSHRPRHKKAIRNRLFVTILHVFECSLYNCISRTFQNMYASYSDTSDSFMKTGLQAVDVQVVWAYARGSHTATRQSWLQKLHSGSLHATRLTVNGVLKYM